MVRMSQRMEELLSLLRGSVTSLDSSRRPVAVALLDCKSWTRGRTCYPSWRRLEARLQVLPSVVCYRGKRHVLKNCGPEKPPCAKFSRGPNGIALKFASHKRPAKKTDLVETRFLTAEGLECNILKDL
ncbi:uncharacterized protein AB9W97_016138 isoform 1-T1 [Spinachia spinachia]